MTKLEEQWTDAIVQLGCVVCYLQGFPGTPAEVHHLLRGGRRIGHLDTIPLCSPGHHRNGDGGTKISRHPFKVRFERAYGHEQQLLELTKELVAELRSNGFLTGRLIRGTRGALLREQDHESEGPD